MFIRIVSTAAFVSPSLLTLLWLKVHNHAFYECLFSVSALLLLGDLKNIIFMILATFHSVRKDFHIKPSFFLLCLLSSFLPPVSYSPWIVNCVQEAPEPPVTWEWRQEKKRPDGIKRYAFLGCWWLSLQSSYQQGDYGERVESSPHHCKASIVPYRLQ